MCISMSRSPGPNSPSRIERTSPSLTSWRNALRGLFMDVRYLLRITATRWAARSTIDEVGELVGVRDDAHGLDLAVGDIERDDGRRPAVGVARQAPRAAVDIHGLQRDPGGAALGPRDPDHETRDVVAAVERAARRLRLAAAVGVDHDVGREQLDQAVGVAALGGLDESLGQLLLLLTRDVEPGVL